MPSFKSQVWAVRLINPFEVNATYCMERNFKATSLQRVIEKREEKRRRPANHPFSQSVD